jgi:predicted PurR-regulated permease PerM
MPDVQRPSNRNLLLNAAAFMVVIAGMRAASSLVVRLLIAFFIAFVCGPLFFWLKKHKVPTSVAIILVLLVITAFGSLLGVLIGTSVNDFTEAWPTYQAKFTKLVSGTVAYLNERGVEIPRDTVLDVLNPGTIMNVIGGMLTTLTSMLSETVLILIAVVFILLEAASVPGKVTAVWGNDSKTMKDLERFSKIMQKYIMIKTLISLATGLIVGLSMMFVGVDFALLWGLLAFLLNYVPTIGSIIAAIPPTLLAFVQLGWIHAVIVLSIFLIINMAIGNIFEPRTMGKGMGLSTLIVFISLVFWGWVLGPVGMLLSVPLTMSVKIYLESRKSTQWLGIMLGRSAERQTSMVKE